jgi:tetratricopeptide (TPR) repeat protein
MTFPSGEPSRRLACDALARVQFTETALVGRTVTAPNVPERRLEYPYAQLLTNLVVNGDGYTALLRVPAQNDLGYRMLCGAVGDFTANPALRQMTDALQVLKAGAARPPADFEAIARSYRAEAVKPELPEAARRWRVQAESAVRAQQFDEAADLFDAALLEAPWWPEGHFNRALVLGEAGDPSGAITEMRRYLALLPEAPDARAAQDKIYEWERVVPAPTLPAAAPAAGK